VVKFLRRLILNKTETEATEVTKVYKLQSISQICSVVSARVMIYYSEDTSVLNEWFKGNEIVEADGFVSLDEGEVAICHDPKGGFYLIEPL